jgi:hypothetical protein
MVPTATSVLVLAALAAGCGSGGSSTSAPSVAATSQSGASSGGEASIEEFGSEAEGASRAAILGAFTGYLRSIAAGDSGEACVYLSAAVKHSLSQLSASGSQEGAGCPVALSQLLAPAAAAIARRQARGRVIKARVKGAQAFVVFHAPGAKLYQLTMVREDGKWEAATVTASVLVPSAATLGN